MKNTWGVLILIGYLAVMLIGTTLIIVERWEVLRWYPLFIALALPIWCYTFWAGAFGLGKWLVKKKML